MTEGATPLPDEIAGLIELLCIATGPLQDSVRREAVKQLRSLAQENEKHFETERKLDKVIFDQYQRIRELEAETERLRDSVNTVRAEYLQRYMNATTRIIELKAERDAIRAKTTEECIEALYDSSLLTKADAMHGEGAIRRARAQTDEAIPQRDGRQASPGEG